VRFETSTELRLFAESVQSAVAGWAPPREPVFGEWWDEHDDVLLAAVEAVGFAELWSDDSLRGAAVAGGIILGRALAPLSLVDQATLGGALATGGRARHLVTGRPAAYVGDGGLVLVDADDLVASREPALDGSGTVRLGRGPAAAPQPDDASARLRAWAAGTLGYLAGLGMGSLEGAVAHVRSREQFGAPLASLPTMQARLADAALAVDGLELVAWEAAVAGAGDAPLPREALRWASGGAREVTAIAQQAHGGVGFALESGVHRAYRRAKSSQAWVGAVLDELASSSTP
jgi:hypothetical protein